MTALIGGVVGWFFFVGGLICWYLDQTNSALVLLTGAYLCHGYASGIVINESTRTLRQAAVMLEEARKKMERGGRA